MVSITSSYECDTCKTIFLEKEEAELCEKSHLNGGNLNILDFFYSKGDAQFPQRLLIECKNYSGVAALYTLSTEDSVEGFSYLYPEEE